LFPNDDKVGMKHIKKYVEMMKAENVSRAVLVLQQNLTPFAKSFLIELEPMIHMEIFRVSPVHRVVTVASSLEA
jgi:DNA-directed RNA polymerases I, II, and III subunit RPABC1